MQVSPGTRLGPYEIVTSLGSGGMLTVGSTMVKAPHIQELRNGVK